MATEIERKFLVVGESWRNDASAGVRYRQGYLSSDKNCSVRVRIGGGKAALNIKSATLGVTRTEFDYPIPVGDADEILDRLCVRPTIEKVRFDVPVGEHTWEVDVFEGDNAGLIVAEVELDSVDEVFERPAWLGREVSDDPRYYNVCLVEHPFKDWKERHDTV